MSESHNCGRCSARGSIEPASQVATGESGLQWFECLEHDELDNEAGERRVRREPFESWLRRAHAAALAARHGWGEPLPSPAPAPLPPELLRAELGAGCGIDVRLINHGSEPVRVIVLTGAKVSYRLLPVEE
jgi:hypothetical protein